MTDRGQDPLPHRRRDRVPVECGAGGRGQVECAEDHPASFAERRLGNRERDAAVEGLEPGAQQVEAGGAFMAGGRGGALRQATLQNVAQLEARAMDPGLDRRLAQTEDGGDLTQPQLGDLGQQQGHPEGRRKLGEPALDQLACLRAEAIAMRIAVERTEVGQSRTGAREELVEGLEPAGLAGAPAMHAGAGAVRDRVEPRPGIVPIAQLVERTVGVEEGLLDQVVRIVATADPAGEGVDPRPLLLEEGGELGTPCRGTGRAHDATLRRRTSRQRFRDPISSRFIPMVFFWVSFPGLVSKVRFYGSPGGFMSRTSGLLPLSSVGTVFAGGWSATGGIKDAINNVENVFVEEPSSTDRTLEVTAAAILGDGVWAGAPSDDPADFDQDFALVCFNCDELLIFADGLEDGTGARWSSTVG